MATSKKKADAASKSLAKTLSSVSAQAKSLGINTAKADSMVAQTKRQGSTSYKGSTEEKAFLASNIGTTSPTIPPPPVTKNEGDMLGMGTATVIPEGYGIQEGMVTKDENASDIMNATNQNNMNLANIAKQWISDTKPVEDQMTSAYEDTYGISRKQAGRDYQRAQQETQLYTNQINAITKDRDANMLALEDTGRGQTTGFIGGEQGRIERQAAIRALPVQAQLAAAQGNLEIAKSHVDSLFQMKVKDIETEQAYKNTVANTWMSVANTQQSNLLNAAIADSNARAAEKSQALSMANEWAKIAMDYGQSSLAGKMMKLDPTSKTFQQDLATLQGQVSKPVSATKIDTAFDKNGNLVNMQTGEIIKAVGGDTTINTPKDFTKTTVENNIDTLSNLFKQGNVSAGNKTAIGNGLALAKAASDLADASDEGAFEGLYPGRSVVDFLTPEAFKRDKTISNESLISALDLQTQFWASGAALSDAQTELVQKMIPTKNDTDSAVKTKTNQLVNYMLSQTASRLITDGIDYKPQPVDLFEKPILDESDIESFNSVYGVNNTPLEFKADDWLN